MEWGILLENFLNIFLHEISFFDFLKVFLLWFFLSYTYVNDSLFTSGLIIPYQITFCKIEALNSIDIMLGKSLSVKTPYFSVYLDFLDEYSELKSEIKMNMFAENKKSYDFWSPTKLIKSMRFFKMVGIFMRILKNHSFFIIAWNFAHPCMYTDHL